MGVIALSAVTTVSCTPMLRDKFDPDKHDLIDPEMGLSRNDYRNMVSPKTPKNGEIINKIEKKPPPPPPLPDLTQLMQMPDLPEVGEEKLVSISVTDDVPLKDVLMELARLAEVDIELDSGIQGGISFIARDKPFSDVIKRISSMASLRYEMEGDILRIERDIPYILTYPIDFLNIERNGSSTVNISTNVLSAGGGGSALNTGSTQSVTSETSSDFWKSLQTGIEQILNYKPANKLAKVQNFVVADGTVGFSQQAQELDDPMSECAMNQQTQSGGGSVLSGGNCRTFYSFNRQAGVLTVSATKRQHTMIRRFVDRIKTSASAQVLIEAKIVETELNDNYQSGIEWSALNDKLGIVTSFNAVEQTNGLFSISLPDRAVDGFGGDIDGTGADLDDFIQLLEEFGTTRTLSSPRLHAINNQQAVLTFAENLVYFELDIQRETDTTSGVSEELFTVDSEAKTVPIGIILTMQPSVNMESGEITLMVRPTLSRVTSFVNDPAVSFLVSQGGVNIQNQIPVVEVRELDSILKVRSGQVMVIGGLMERTSTNSDIGVPGMAEVPWIGNFFKSVDKTEKTRELVILIKATLVGSSGNIAKEDQILYEKFSGDHRPLSFNN